MGGGRLREVVAKGGSTVQPRNLILFLFMFVTKALFTIVVLALVLGYPAWASESKMARKIFS